MYYVGIDVSKRHHDATVIDVNGQVVMAAFRFLNTRQGVTTLLTRLQALDGQRDSLLVACSFLLVLPG